MNNRFRLGIQSYCFRSFPTISSLIECLQQVDLAYVELYPGHLDFNADESTITAALAQLDASGITVDGYGAVSIANDESMIRRYLQFCRQANVACGTIGDIDDAAEDLLQQLCDEYEMNVAMHNHGRKHRYGSYESIRELLSRTGPRVGVCLDTAWALDAGEDPVEGIELFADRLYGVHLKDFVFGDDGTPEDVIIGRGGLDVPVFMQNLSRCGFDGYMSLEYEGNPENPVPEIVECVAVVRETIASLL